MQTDGNQTHISSVGPPMDLAEAKEIASQVLK